MSSIAIVMRQFRSVFLELFLIILTIWTSVLRTVSWWTVSENPAQKGWFLFSTVLWDDRRRVKTSSGRVVEMSTTRQLEEGSSSKQLDISTRTTSSCSEIRRNWRILKVAYRRETARRSPFNFTPRTGSSWYVKFRMANISAMGNPIHFMFGSRVEFSVSAGRLEWRYFRFNQTQDGGHDTT